MQTDGQNMLGKLAIGRRSFVVAALAFWAIPGAQPLLAQQRRRRRRQQRRIRRRALRRFRRRGNGIPERARQAVRDGDIRPLRDVMAAVRRRSSAEVLDVDLHRNERGWIYALRVMTEQGRVRDVFLDARTLELLHLGKRTGEDGVPLPPQLDEPDAGPVVVPPPPTRRPGAPAQPNYD